MRNVSHCSINVSISISEVTVYFFWRQQTEYGRGGSSGCILLTWRVSYCPRAPCVCPDFLEDLHCLHVSVSPFSSQTIGVQVERKPILWELDTHTHSSRAEQSAEGHQWNIKCPTFILLFILLLINSIISICEKTNMLLLFYSYWIKTITAHIK